MSRRAFVLVIGWTFFAGENPSDQAAPKTEEFQLVAVEGEVVPFRAALEQQLGIKLAGSEADRMLAMKTKQGRLLTILPTRNARIFYLDSVMQKRRVQITARIYDRTEGLQVIDVHTIKEGKLYEVYYWCGICAIKSYARLPCECCQEPVELREEAVPEANDR
jgi:hypothetical protein